MGLVRIASFVGAFAGAIAALGCAAAHRGPAPAADRASLTPKQIYSVGETRYAEGRFAEAVALWQHALLALPDGEHGDAFRHALVLRIAYGQLMAWSKRGETVFLTDAQQMLYGYLDLHEALMGEGEAASAARGEVYELLYEVERHLPGGEADDAEAEDEAESGGGDDGGAEPPIPATDTIAAPSVGAQSGRDREQGREVRHIRVRRERPSVDDPEARALLRSTFADGMNGYVLARPEYQRLYETRALVRSGAPRIAGAPKAGGAAAKRARKLGRAVLSAAREDLTACYESALARHPTPVAKATVTVAVADTGAVAKTTIVRGGLIDELGDLCMAAALTNVALPAGAVGGAQALELPITFFVEGSVDIHELDGSSKPQRSHGLAFDGPPVVTDPAKPAR